MPLLVTAPPWPGPTRFVGYEESHNPGEGLGASSELANHAAGAPVDSPEPEFAPDPANRPCLRHPLWGSCSDRRGARPILESWMNAAASWRPRPGRGVSCRGPGSGSSRRGPCCSPPSSPIERRSRSCRCQREGPPARAGEPARAGRCALRSPTGRAGCSGADGPSGTAGPSGSAGQSGRRTGGGALQVLEPGERAPQPFLQGDRREVGE